MKLQLIVNPRAGSGRAAARIPQIERALVAHGIAYEKSLTEGPYHAARLARQARDNGFDVIAAVGGDGTLNEIAQSYISEQGEPLGGPDLALIPAGTGGDFRKTFGLADEIHAAVSRLHSAKPRPVDLGVVELVNHLGQVKVFAFVNVMSFGVGGLTDRFVNQAPKWMGGRAAFLLGALKATLNYRNLPVSLRVDDAEYLQGPIYNVAICNGRFFGGGMQVAPKADPSDGLFDVVAMCDLTRAQGILLARHIYRGSHLGRPQVQLTRGSVIEASAMRSADEVLIDLDGETPGRLPLTARIAKAALSFRV